MFRAACGVGWRLVGAFVVCVVGVGWVCVGSAAAAGVVFGGEGERAGQFFEPVDLAVDNAGVGSSSGDLYVADRNNDRVDKFSSSGQFLLAWGWGVVDGQEKFEACGPEGSPAGAECYAGSQGAGAGEFGLANIFGTGPVGVAVDDALSSSVGDVYVVDGSNHRVEKFGGDGEFLLAWGWGGM
jgi:DNA-binding beta-propeller fold protein YncE